jgi:hypothetical protein
MRHPLTTDKMWSFGVCWSGTESFTITNLVGAECYVASGWEHVYLVLPADDRASGLLL